MPITTFPLTYWVAAIAQWIHLHLPFCHPRFKSQAHHLCFYQFILICVMWKRRKQMKNRPGLAHLKRHFHLQQCDIISMGLGRRKYSSSHGRSVGVVISDDVMFVDEVDVMALD